MTKSCECGICDHYSESECIQKECKCCLNFHERSGPKSKVIILITDFFCNNYIFLKSV